MPHARHAIALAALLALALALTGCAGSSGSGGSAELIPDERPVPPGTPVMYEFYTET